MFKSDWGGDWLAIGDAASSYDPLSSQGIFKGIADGILAAPAILNAISGDKDQLRKFCLNIQSRFKQYLQERRMFYLSEQRWPKSMFWLRRQKRVWPDYSIWLDPDQRLPNLRMPQPADLSQTKAVSPSVDFAELIRIAADAKCAREAVSVYREVCDPCSDQEIIVALQHLLLSVNKQLSTGRIESLIGPIPWSCLNRPACRLNLILTPIHSIALPSIRYAKQTSSDVVDSSKL